MDGVSAQKPTGGGIPCRRVSIQLRSGSADAEKPADAVRKVEEKIIMAVYGRHCRLMRSMKLPLLLFAGCLLHTSGLMAEEEDAVILKNGDKITGKIKSLNKADLKIDPDYGNNIFTIDWEEVKHIETVTNFAIETSTRLRLIGTLRTDPDSGDRIIVRQEGSALTVFKSDIVSLDPVKKTFWGRMDLGADFGLSLTAANSSKKVNARLKAGYVGEKWSTGIQYDTLYEVQKDTETEAESKINRSELRGDYRRNISGKWYALGFTDFLRSSELALNLRTTVGGGVGNYLVRNNGWALSTTAGGDWSNEKYEDPATETKDSAEAFTGLEFDLFNIGDLDIYSSFKVTPSLTDPGRLRIDLKSDLSWELIDDLYFRVGFSNNYDNNPPTGSYSNDYVFSVSIGWSY